MIKIGIRLKVISFISLLLIVVITFLNIFVLNRIKSYQKSETESLLINQKDMIEEYLNEQFKSYSNDTEKNILKMFSANVFDKFSQNNMPVKIYTAEGSPIRNIRLGKNEEIYENKDQILKYIGMNKIVYKQKDNIIYFFSPLKFNDKTVAILEIDYNNINNIEHYNRMKNLFVGIGFASVILGIILASLYFLKVTRDLIKINNQVRFVEKGEYENIKVVNRNDEIGELSKGVLYMSQSIEKNINNLNEERKNLKLAVDKLNKMTEEQKQFIGSVTHEFKTPIAAIKAYADLLNMYGDDKELVKEAGVTISNQTDRLKSLVDKILHLSSLEKYDFELNVEKIDLNSVIGQICKSMEFKGKKQNVKIKNEVEEVFVYADEECMKHVFINLLDNGIKYNKSGGEVLITSNVDKEWCIVQVRDTGIGIDKEHIKKVFNPFYRVDSQGIDGIKGTGLGLSLVKNLVEKNKGKVWVESEKEEGSSFFVKIKIFRAV